ncbi:DUF1308 domain-containing protein [Sorangium sp. So ce887]
MIIGIFGTGDQIGAVTMSNDKNFVKGAKAQGVVFPAFIHRPISLRGK